MRWKYCEVSAGAVDRYVRKSRRDWNRSQSGEVTR